MSYYVFDLDGTLADVEHRRYFVGTKNWDGFFEACDQDPPISDVINLLRTLFQNGHRVEIWSGRSDQVREKTENWLKKNVGLFAPGILKHMRKQGDFTPDHVLKKAWLDAEPTKPDMIFDDRQSVVDMWRENGVTCAQVAPGDFDDSKNIYPGGRLILLVGPSGAGKSTFIQNRILNRRMQTSWIVSSDGLRQEICGDFKDQSKNKQVFAALHAIVKARLESGLTAVVDATNLRRKDRMSLAGLAPEDTPICYTVLNRPMNQKIFTGGWRNEVKVKGKPLMQYHEEVFNSQLKDILSGDGIAEVVDLRKT